MAAGKRDRPAEDAVAALGPVHFRVGRGARGVPLALDRHHVGIAAPGYVYRRPPRRARLPHHAGPPAGSPATCGISPRAARGSPNTSRPMVTAMSFSLASDQASGLATGRTLPCPARPALPLQRQGRSLNPARFDGRLLLSRLRAAVTARGPWVPGDGR